MSVQYLLDDDIEFYNDAEPMTTRCPLLPGQPVNVLSVPIILPDSRNNHSRDSSVSSQRSNYRTMNPEDKFLNPRRPPRPQLSRLRTSPQLLQQPTPSWSFSTSPLGLIGRSTSQPTSAAPKPGNRQLKERGTTKVARSVSPPRSRGIRTAFRYFNVSSSDLEIPPDERACVPDVDDAYSSSGTSAASSGLIQASAAVPEAAELAADPAPVSHSFRGDTRGHGQLVFRQPGYGAERAVIPMPIQSRRVLNSRSRDPSPQRNPLTLAAPSDFDFADAQSLSTQQPVTLSGIQSERATPTDFTTASAAPAARKPASPRPSTIKEKRLPTLPNTPSSVMDDAIRAMDARDCVPDMQALYSRFSDATSSLESVAEPWPIETSRFSEWSTNTDALSPDSMISSSTFCNDKSTLENGSRTTRGSTVQADEAGPNTPRIGNESQSPSPMSIAGNDNDDPDSLPIRLSLPRLTISFSPSDLEISGLGIHDFESIQNNPKRHAAMFDATESMSRLGLVPSPDASTVTFSEDVRPASRVSFRAGADDGGQNKHRLSGQQGGSSTVMQELMDELSYLTHVIEAGAETSLSP